MIPIILVTIFVGIAQIAAASDAVVTRRDGFLLVWKTLKRPVGQMRLRPVRYDDVPVGSRGEDVITFARHRSLLGAQPNFFPDGALTAKSALIWILKTRNVAADPEQVSEATLAEWLQKYKLNVPEGGLDVNLSLSSLSSMIADVDRALAEEVHIVSNYGIELHGAGTAFGETFDMHAITAAHKLLPYNTLVRVTNIENGKSVVVRINDRGPFVEGRDMDLSTASFDRIADGKTGILRARFERLGDVSLAGSCYKEPRYVRAVGNMTLSPGMPTFMHLGATLSLTSERIFQIQPIALQRGEQTAAQWIAAGTAFQFTPAEKGLVRFRITDTDGHRRVLSTMVIDCAAES